MSYESDGFISYSHLDNVELAEGHKGWVTNLHSALEKKVSQLLGRQLRFWRDPKLSGNDLLSDTLIDQLHSVAVLVSILSPGYVRSEWGMRELEEFCRAAERQGGIRIDDKARIFKVLKTPVPRDQHPRPLQALLGYEFFRVDPETGRVHELDEIFGPDAKWEFWLKLEDLAHDICSLLQLLVPEAATGRPSTEARSIYLAETTSDLREPRDAIKRELQQRGYTVLPVRALPLSAPEATAAIRDDLAQCGMSIHMIGRNYSLVPEGGVASLLELQNTLAIERGGKDSFTRLVWIPRGTTVTDARQQAIIDGLRMDERVHAESDLLEGSLEDLKTQIDTRLKQSPKAPELRVDAGPKSTSTQVYLLYDSRDADAITPWSDMLFEHFEVIHPVFSGDEAELRQYHDECLRTCDGVVIFYGAASALWVKRKLAELQKSAGYGRTKPRAEVAICLIPPLTAEKARFRSHQALVIPQWDGPSPDLLESFVSALKARSDGRESGRDEDSA